MACAANRPSGSIKIRVKTYAHTLMMRQEALADKAALGTTQPATPAIQLKQKVKTFTPEFEPARNRIDVMMVD